MADIPARALGPEPFRFTPAGGPFIEGSAFTFTFKAVTTLTILGAGTWLALVWIGERARGGGGGLLAWFLAAFVMLVFFWWWILRSRTRIDSQRIHQSWFADKAFDIAELAAVGVLRVRRFEWLVAPRVHVRNIAGKFAVIQAADPLLLDEFERLARELKAFHQR